MAHIRTWADIEARAKADGFDKAEDWLTPAELKLRDAAVAGEVCNLAWELPPELAEGEEPNPERQIRADVLRYLILGGCDDYRTDDAGVMLAGAHVTGTLDVSQTVAREPIRIMITRFGREVRAEDARMQSLALVDCHLAGVFARNLSSASDLTLRGSISQEPIDLSSAEISGALLCDDTKLRSDSGPVLRASRIKTKNYASFRNVQAAGSIGLQGAAIGGSLFFENADLGGDDRLSLDGQGIHVNENIILTNARSRGEVSLDDGNVGQSLVLIQAEFAGNWQRAISAVSLAVRGDINMQRLRVDGLVDVSSCTIKGRLIVIDTRFGHDDNAVFKAKNTTISEDFVWRPLVPPGGPILLTNAHASVLEDDPNSWPGPAGGDLSGFTFNLLINAPTKASIRKDWLSRFWKGQQSFSPVPYTQFAKILREMGHDPDARELLMERDRLLGIHERTQRVTDQNGRPLLGPLALVKGAVASKDAVIDLLFRVVAGSGYRPSRSVFTLATLIAITWAIAWMAFEKGDFAPNSDVIQTSPEWVELAETAENPARAWSAGTEAGRDWETFNSFAYALDVVVPIVDFGQTEAWAPSTSRGPWGWHLWWLKWLMTGLGWIVTAIGAAAITGIIRRD